MATKSEVNLTDKKTVNERLTLIDNAKSSILRQMPESIAGLIKREYNHLKASALCNPEKVAAEVVVRAVIDFSAPPTMSLSLGVTVDWPEVVSEDQVVLILDK